MTRASGHGLLARGLVALVPWVNVAIVGLVLGLLLLPRAAEGHALATIAALVLGVMALPMIVAAIAFSREVLTGRYPPEEDR